MAQQDVNIGNRPDDPNADTVREGFDKVNQMTQEIYPTLEAAGNGLVGYETKADMDAVTPGSEDPNLAVVTNDSTTANNGYYRYDESASAWVAFDEFYATTLDDTDTSEATTGKAVGDYVKGKIVEDLDPSDTDNAVTGQSVNRFVFPRNHLEIQSKADQSSSSNLFDNAKVVDNRDINSVGEVVTDTNNDISNYIKVDPSTEYYRSGDCQIVEYNNRGIFIQRESGHNSTNYTTNSETHYVILVGTGFPQTFYFSLASNSGEDFTTFKEDRFIDTYESDRKGYFSIDGNLLDTTVYTNQSINSDGYPIDQDTSWLLTNYIPVSPETTYYFFGTIDHFAIYGREKRFIRRVASPSSDVTFSSNEYYIRIVIRTVNESNAVFSREEGTHNEAKFKTRLLEKDEISFDELRDKYKSEPYEGCRQIPADLLSRNEITIEFDFYPDFDIHNGDDRIDLFGFGSGVNESGAGNEARYNVYFMRKPHQVDSIFFPRFMSYFGINSGNNNNEGNIESGGTQSPHAWYLSRNLCGEDALSIRKMNPASGDYGTRVTIDDSFTIHDDSGIIYSTPLSDHTTVKDLGVDLNDAAELSDYEIIIYSGKRLAENIQKMNDVVIVANNTFADEPDAYPLYVPMSSKGKKYHFKFTAKIHEDDQNVIDAMAYLNGHPLHFTLISNASGRSEGWDFKGLDFVIGGLLDSQSNAFSGTIDNITIKNKYEHAKRKLMVFGHIPGSGFDEGLNTSTIQKVYYDSIEKGYTWVDGQEMCRLENTRGDIESSPNRVISLGYDDGRWDVWDFEEHRAMLQKLNIKPILFIPLNRIDPSNFPERAEIVKQAHSAGWTLGIHSTNDASINELTYDELKANIDQANVYLHEIGIHSNIFAYPRNQWSIHGAKVLRNEFGNAVLYSTNASGGYYGFNNMYATRFPIQNTTLDDVIDEDNISNYSKAQFINLNNPNWSLS